jgi:hypothetical protein
MNKIMPSFAHYQQLLQRRLQELDVPLRQSLREIQKLPFHPEIDLAQFEFMHEDSANVFPILLLTKRRSEGIDRYTHSQSYDYNRSTFCDRTKPQYYSGAKYLLEEPLVDEPLLRYYFPEEIDDSLLGQCDEHFLNAVSQWFTQIWQEEIGADFPIAAYFLMMCDDADDVAYDLRQARQVRWTDMYGENDV